MKLHHKINNTVKFVLRVDPSLQPCGLLALLFVAI